MWHAVASQCYPYKLLFYSSPYYKWRFLPSEPSAVTTPPFCHHSSSPSLHLSVFQDLREYHHHRQPCPVLRDTAAEVWLLDLPHFMLPWCLCVHMLGDYVRPLKHPVDEIICALWAMYWHHKHYALFLSSLAINAGDIFKVACQG